jgi:polyisoprenoid-binding protein YceI
VPVGEWSVDPVRSSASFTARVAGRSVQGRLPLTGAARISTSLEESAARLVAYTPALTTGSGLLDRMLVGSGFLEAEAFPEISFRSEMLVRVPSGWRAVGELEVKGREHPMTCSVTLQPAA